MNRFPKSIRRVALSLCLAACTGCATSLSTMDTARTTPVGHVQADVAMGVYLPAGATLDALQSANDVATQPSLSPEQADALVRSLMTVALMPPAPISELMVRTGVSSNLDLGLRLASTSTRLDAKYRFFHRGTPDDATHDAAVGFGISKFRFGGMVFDNLEKLKLDDFSRWDFEVPLLYSFEFREFLVLYGGAKYILSSFSLDPNLFDIQRRIAGALHTPPATDAIKSSMHYFGTVGGIGVGYKYVYLLLELDVGYTVTRPRLWSFVDGQVSERTLGGLTLYPALGLLVRI